MVDLRRKTTVSGVIIVTWQGSNEGTIHHTPTPPQVAISLQIQYGGHQTGNTIISTLG